MRDLRRPAKSKTSAASGGGSMASGRSGRAAAMAPSGGGQSWLGTELMHGAAEASLRACRLRCGSSRSQGWEAARRRGAGRAMAARTRDAPQETSSLGARCSGARDTGRDRRTGRKAGEQKWGGGAEITEETAEGETSRSRAGGQAGARPRAVASRGPRASPHREGRMGRGAHLT